MDRDELHDTTPTPEEFDDFFEISLSGNVIARQDGTIIRANKTLAGWLGLTSRDLTGKKFSELLNIGGRIYYETHLGPLLRMQGFFDEVALELQSPSNGKLPVMINALERKGPNGEVLFVRFTVFRAADRRVYEQNLKDAKASLEMSLANANQVALLREQLIAILGHDLRNPLGSVIAGASVLARSELPESETKIVQIINRSAARMAELVSNIMDFARTRLGEGIVINPKPTDIEPTLEHVIDELTAAWPNRVIRADFHLDEPVNCDVPRIAQVFSNLLTNAITHGRADTEVSVKAISKDGLFELTVCNAGEPIVPEMIGRLFEPFTRDANRPSQNGLGLGLYIASQISKAHKGQIIVSSTEKETCFTFRLQGYPELASGLSF
jgi:phosphoserine phosphatase RsbU/P